MQYTSLVPFREKERIIFEQHKTPSTSSISSGKWGFASDHLHLSSLPKHYWGLLVDLFPYKMSSADLALCVPHSKDMVFLSSWSFLPVCSGFPHQSIIGTHSCPCFPLNRPPNPSHVSGHVFKAHESCTASFRQLEASR